MAIKPQPASLIIVNHQELLAMIDEGLKHADSDTAITAFKLLFGEDSVARCLGEEPTHGVRNPDAETEADSPTRIAK
jgi:hypothetical protein